MSVPKTVWFPVPIGVVVLADAGLVVNVLVPEKLSLLQRTGVFVPIDTMIVDDVTVLDVVGVALLALHT